MIQDEGLLEDVVRQVMAHERYQHLAPELVKGLVRQELAKGRSLRETVKAVRSKLHQVAASYLESPIDYAVWLERLRSLPAERTHPEVKAFCLDMMRLHASTRERLPYLDAFYQQTLAPIGEIHSLLDLASGLNPLTVPWLPLAEGARIMAWEIYADMVAFLNRFFAHMHLAGQAEQKDVTSVVPDEPFHVVFLLKAIPCLEQLDKSLGRRLLETLQAEYILVSFPTYSLGGRGKGMRVNYTRHFEQLVAGKPWTIWRFDFPTELAFLIKKGRVEA
jgi:16S rRNA (guanine(1405)-N(7))-methyltransferase